MLYTVRDECARAKRPSCDIEVSAFLVLYSISDVPLAGPVSGLAGSETGAPRTSFGPSRSFAKFVGFTLSGVVLLTTISNANRAAGCGARTRPSAFNHL